VPTRLSAPTSRFVEDGIAAWDQLLGGDDVNGIALSTAELLVDACHLWAFAALSASPGVRRCYDAHRARGQTHHQALRALGNRLVGILHGCLAHRVAYQEQLAWPAV
jgi:hypothetical protein